MLDIHYPADWIPTSSWYELAVALSLMTGVPAMFFLMPMDVFFNPVVWNALWSW